METLTKLINDGKCVTKMSLFRQTTLDIREVENLMREFYEQHKNDLYAVFLVFGTKQNDGEVGDIRQSVLCNQASLETTQKEFIGFTSTTIYSLHKSSTTTIRNLLNTDLSGKYVQPAATCHNRLGIISPLALEAVRTWNKRNPKAVYSDYVIPEFMSQADKTERPIAKSIIVKSDQHSLKDAFAVAIKQNEKLKQMETESNEQGGMKRLLEGSIENIQKKPTKKAKNGQMSLKQAFFASANGK